MVSKVIDSLSAESLVLGKLARHLCLQSIFLVGERAKRARHYQGCTNSSWCGTYIYIHICMEVRMSY